MEDPDIHDGYPISEPPPSSPPLDGTHYREIACGLRILARRCRFVASRRELLNLAASFERRAKYFDCVRR